MKRVFNLLVVFMLVIVSAPVFASAKKFMPKAMETWLGYSIDNVISVWGVPQNQKEIAGKTYYEWSSSKSVYIPQSSNTYLHANSYGYNTNGYATTNTYGGYTQNYYCNRVFGVDEKGTVIFYQWEGNNCYSSYRRGKVIVNPQNDVFAQEIAEKKRIKEEKKRIKAEQKEAKRLLDSQKKEEE